MAKTKGLLHNTALLTFIAMIIGSGLGLAFGKTMGNYKFIGTIWINSISMIIVPLVLCIMVTAIGSQKDIKALGKVVVRILSYYFITTAMAAIIGLSLGLLLKPGAGVVLDGLATKEITAGDPLSLSSFFLSLFSNNMFNSFASGQMLQTLIISIFLGTSLLFVKNEEKKATILNWFEAATEMIFVYIKFVIKLTPIGVLFLMADTFGNYGFAIFTTMLSLISTFWIGVLTQILLVYCVFLWMTVRMNPLTFIKKSMPVWTFTIASCSSTATIPISIKTAEEEFGVPRHIADFCLPLGAQINYDGSAILYTTVLVFISNLYGMNLDLGTLIKMAFVATLLASSGGGIPGGGIVKLLIVVNTFALPVEVVGVIAGFYRLFDMGTTTCNCLGDLVGTVFASKIAKKEHIMLEESA